MTTPYCVIGRHGFIGGALAAKLGDTTSYPIPETKYIFNFASYTHPNFEANPEFHMQSQLSSFQDLLAYASKRNIMIIYPSSALVYEKETTFSKFKKILEELAGCYKVRTLGLRIFPVYGPGEDHTVISKWCKEMKDGEQPIIYGDGTQARDFIYIDDVITQILCSLEIDRWNLSRVIDIGTGQLTQFNDIIRMINLQLGTDIKPHYVCRPSSYSEGIWCRNPLPYSFQVRDGIQQLLSQRVLEHQV